MLTSVFHGLSTQHSILARSISSSSFKTIFCVVLWLVVLWAVGERVQVHGRRQNNLSLSPMDLFRSILSWEKIDPLILIYFIINVDVEVIFLGRVTSPTHHLLQVVQSSKKQKRYTRRRSIGVPLDERR